MSSGSQVDSCVSSLGFLWGAITSIAHYVDNVKQGVSRHDFRYQFVDELIDIFDMLSVGEQPH